MPYREHDAPESAAAVAASMAKLLNDFRVQCEVEGLLSTYEEMYEYHLGEDAYSNYILNEWIQHTAFNYEVLKGAWEHYRVALVMAHVASARKEIGRGRLASAKDMLQQAEMLRHDLNGDLPSDYVDPSIEDQRPSQRGGLVKDVNRKCKAILNCLEANHQLDGKDFKSFDEAVEYGIEMWISEEQADGSGKLRALNNSLPGLFKEWLRRNADEADRFKVCTGFAWSD